MSRALVVRQWRDTDVISSGGDVINASVSPVRDSERVARSRSYRLASRRGASWVERTAQHHVRDGSFRGRKSHDLPTACARALRLCATHLPTKRKKEHVRDVGERAFSSFRYPVDAVGRATACDSTGRLKFSQCFSNAIGR